MSKLEMCRIILHADATAEQREFMRARGLNAHDTSTDVFQEGLTRESSEELEKQPWVKRIELITYDDDNKLTWKERDEKRARNSGQ